MRRASYENKGKNPTGSRGCEQDGKDKLRPTAARIGEIMPGLRNLWRSVPSPSTVRTEESKKKKKKPPQSHIGGCVLHTQKSLQQIDFPVVFFLGK
jgi:hypothetical protein